MFRKAILGLLIVCSTHVFAAEITAESINSEAAKIETALDKCMADAVANSEMGECSLKKHKSADVLLNKVYKARVAVLKEQVVAEKNEGPLGQFGDETLKRLVKAQRAWIAFRDAECDLEGADMLHGSGESLLISGCLADTTLKRAVKLGEFFGSSDPK